MRLQFPLLFTAASVALVVGIGTTGAASAGPLRPASTVVPQRQLIGYDTDLVAPAGVAFDVKGRMYVTNLFDDSVTVYVRNWASGATAPIRTLKGPATGLSGPVGLTFDSQGRMYVANSGLTLSPNLTLGTTSVTMYASNWASGDTAPIKTLRGAATGLTVASGVAVDGAGNLSVANAGRSVFLPNVNASVRAAASATGAPSVTTYAAGWKSGNTAPTKTLKGAATGLGLNLGGIAFDSHGLLHVVNMANKNFDPQSGSVTVYATNYAGGNTAPSKTLAGDDTGLTTPVSIAFDARGRMLITDAQSRTVQVYRPTWRNGNSPPAQTINTATSIPPAGLLAPAGIAIDARGVLYVSNLTLNSLESSVVALPGPPVPPNAPTNLTAVRTNVARSIGSLGDVVGRNIRLSWTASVARNSRVTGYVATCATPGKVLRATLAATARSVILEGAGAIKYTCTVRATSAAGPSPVVSVRNA